MQTNASWRLTVANILSIMAVAFAAIGFVRTSFGIPPELEYLKVACLIVVHACFTWRLTKALGRFLQLRGDEANKWKARAAFTLMAFYAGVDVWLVHSGLGWVFSGWQEGALYLASAGFTAINLLGDWVDHRGEKASEALAAPASAPRLSAPPVLLAGEPSEECKANLIKLDEIRKRMARVG